MRKLHKDGSAKVCSLVPLNTGELLGFMSLGSDSTYQQLIKARGTTKARETPERIYRSNTHDSQTHQPELKTSSFMGHQTSQRTQNGFALVVGNMNPS